MHLLEEKKLLDKSETATDSSILQSRQQNSGAGYGTPSAVPGKEDLEYIQSVLKNKFMPPRNNPFTSATDDDPLQGVRQQHPFSQSTSCRLQQLIATLQRVRSVRCFSAAVGDEHKTTEP